MKNKKYTQAVSYDKWLEEKIEEIKKKNFIPSLLLHSCCAPCSSYVLEYLSQYFSITIFFYNPNIHPDTEYQKRLKEQIKFIKHFPAKNEVKLITGPYEPDLFFHTVKGLEQEKEGQKRCLKCYQLRLEKTAFQAFKLGFPYFTTTLTISPHKNAKLINQLGAQVASYYKIEYLFSDFKKKEGFKQSVLLSHQYQLYRQNYCGCIFSQKSKNRNTI